MDKLKLQTKDLTEENISKITKLFPELITEIEKDGKKIKTINLNKLKEVVGDYADDSDEVYELTWAGKQKSRQHIVRPINKTLRPAPEESVDFENTENLYIEGDNFEVLKLLQESYLNKVKMIYIDPPYNTGKDFVYKDNFAMSREEYDEETKAVDEEGNKLFKNTTTNGRFHSDWLSMMYERLVIAKDLLRDDGVICISIDDNEVANLKKICDEIFGESNFIVLAPTIMNLKGNNDQFAFSGTHEYTLIYGKNKDEVTINEFDIKEDELYGWEIDEKGYYKKGSGLLATSKGKYREERPYMYFPILIKDEKISMISLEEYQQIYDKNKKQFDDDFVDSIIKKYESQGYNVQLPLDSKNEKLRWTWGFGGKFKEECDEIILTYIEKNNSYSLNKKQRPSIGDLPTKKPKSFFYKPNYSSGTGTSDFESLFNVTNIFQNPKPVSLLKDLIELCTSKNDIVMDFFSGSATTAHSLYLKNSEDQLNRKFLLIQLDENLDKNLKNCDNNTKITIENSIKFLDSIKKPHLITEIGKERIRRAGKKIKDELKEKFKQKKLDENAINPDKLDFGFRVFKLDSSNMKDVFYNPTEIDQRTLSNFKDNIKEDRTDKDLLYQVLLELAVPISAKVHEETINKKTIYRVNDNFLVACFDENIDLDTVKKIADLNPLRLVFRDSSFKDDATKVNCDEYLKNKLPNAIIKVI